MAEMTPERIAEIRQRAQQATKGPWEVAPCSSDDEVRNVVSEYKRVEGGAQANWIAELDASLDFDSDIEGELERLQADAEFIAHARQDIPDLLDALARAQQEIVDLREAVERYGWHSADCLLPTGGKWGPKPCTCGFEAVLAPHSPGETGGTT